MRRGLRGLGPLNGTGVLSLIEEMATPLEINERIEDSRPEPTPLTTISISFKPAAIALSANCSATFPAAKGVPFLAPLNPREPEEDHKTAPPLSSAKSIVVLL